jgi:hypothetical protein
VLHANTSNAARKNQALNRKDFSFYVSAGFLVVARPVGLEALGWLSSGLALISKALHLGVPLLDLRTIQHKQRPDVIAPQCGRFTMRPRQNKLPHTALRNSKKLGGLICSD